MFRQTSPEIREAKLRQPDFQRAQQCCISDDQLRSRISNYPGRELARSCCIQRDSNNTPQDATEEGRDPLCGVFSPENHAFAWINTTPIELRGETCCQGGDFTVACAIGPVTTMQHDRCLVSVAAEVFHEAAKMCAHNSDSHSSEVC